MKINLRKVSGGTFVAANEHEEESCRKFANDEIYEIDIKYYRNPKFHSKMIKFFHFCFQHWKTSEKLEFMDEVEQFNEFRKDLTKLAGFRIEKYIYRLDGSLEVIFEAESLAYGNMSAERFEACYKAVINAALQTIFLGSKDVDENKLLRFF
jgi:hypothetical protein